MDDGTLWDGFGYSPGRLYVEGKIVFSHFMGQFYPSLIEDWLSSWFQRRGSIPFGTTLYSSLLLL
jgi:hypothetical protein